MLDSKYLELSEAASSDRLISRSALFLH